MVVHNSSSKILFPDHCALRYSLDSCLKYEDKLENKDTGIKLEKLFWNEDSPEKFTSLLEMHEYDISSILNVPDAKADEIVKKFQNLITAVTKEGNFIHISDPSTPGIIFLDLRIIFLDPGIIFWTLVPWR